MHFKSVGEAVCEWRVYWHAQFDSNTTFLRVFGAPEPTWVAYPPLDPSDHSA